MKMGWPEIILVLVVIMFLFGARRLPELARSIGKSLGEFKKGKEEGTRDANKLTGGGPDKNPPNDNSTTT